MVAHRLQDVGRVLIGGVGCGSRPGCPGSLRLISLPFERSSGFIAEPRQAYEIARSLQSGDDVVILTGSTYTIEQVLNPDPYLRHLSNTFGWRMERKTEAKGTLQLELPHGPSPTR